MTDYVKKAGDLFSEGYNCAQSVFLAFAEDFDMDTQTALMLSSSFGGGMGRLREVCGAVSGMFMAAGLYYGYDSPSDIQAKTDHYKLIQELAARFKEKNSSIICRELLGLSSSGPDSYVPEKRTNEYYKKRPCRELVMIAAQILTDYLREHAPQTKVKTKI
ncbi:MAG: C-GCAxxG-C-C family protein [Oscillospiraceae bacterium]|nr:C-GCAxxG-C-C family protein [Oscillospiraceae bacterium]